MLACADASAGAIALGTTGLHYMMYASMYGVTGGRKPVAAMRQPVGLLHATGRTLHITSILSALAKSFLHNC